MVNCNILCLYRGIEANPYWLLRKPQVVGSNPTAGSTDTGIFPFGVWCRGSQKENWLRNLLGENRNRCNCATCNLMWEA